jgi:hypothetical protein
MHEAVCPLAASATLCTRALERSARPTLALPLALGLSCVLQLLAQPPMLQAAPVTSPATLTALSSAALTAPTYASSGPPALLLATLASAAPLTPLL